MSAEKISNQRLAVAVVSIAALQLLLWTNLRNHIDHQQAEVLQAVDAARASLVHSQIAIANGHVHKEADLVGAKSTYYSGAVAHKMMMRPMALRIDDSEPTVARPPQIRPMHPAAMPIPD